VKDQERRFEELSKNSVFHHYERLHMSKLTFFDIQRHYPEIAQALGELPRSFAVPTAFGVYLTRRAWHGIWVNHARGARSSYVHNFLSRYERNGRKISPKAVEIMRIAELRGGFLTYDLLVQALSVTRQFFKEEEKRAMERELAFLVERLRARGENVDLTELEFVEVETVHASCNTKILHGWRHKSRPPSLATNFLWALCPKCDSLLSLSEKELRPQLTP
jgi:hypothetical protein